MTCNVVVIQQPGKPKVTLGGVKRTPIILSSETVAKINANRPQTRVLARTSPVTAIQSNTPVTIGGQGVQGPPGETEGAVFNGTAGETIFGARAVRVVDDIILRPALAQAAHATQVLGIALQSGNSGATIQVRTGGLMSESFWNWAPGLIYCGDDGVLTQTPPATGWVLPIARVKNPTTIEIDVDQPVMRA